ncbi:IQ motif and SEC7 domain-containing protein 1-like isoform X3 [Artemia franciscana]|uniref:SEC7 domain-containing protein n=1 Tax=Artemia franciscana TaxID=6661 RepID=A0AA88LHL2_ARTSF|nr:hypothetical protein QYM36_000974 [Artemia franciscana]KAK2724303.1 hypothetical protein QYM36_000974 [Artemia franciscana]
MKQVYGTQRLRTKKKPHIWDFICGLGIEMPGGLPPLPKNCTPQKSERHMGSSSRPPDYKRGYVNEGLTLTTSPRTPTRHPRSGGSTPHYHGQNSGGKKQTIRKTDEGVKRTRSQTSYELSQDLMDKQIELLERKYGGPVRARKAATTIQRAYRQYMLRRKFASITAMAKADRRLSRRFQVEAWDQLNPDRPRYPEECSARENFNALYKEITDTPSTGRPPRPSRVVSLRDRRQYGVVVMAPPGLGPGTGIEERNFIPRVNTSSAHHRTETVTETVNGTNTYYHQYSYSRGFQTGHVNESNYMTPTSSPANRSFEDTRFFSPSNHVYVDDSGVVRNYTRSVSSSGRVSSGKKPPPEVPKRTTSISNDHTPIQKVRQVGLEEECSFSRQRITERGSQTSVQSSGSDSGASVTAVNEESSPAWIRRNESDFHEISGDQSRLNNSSYHEELSYTQSPYLHDSVVQNPHFLPPIYANVGENLPMDTKVLESLRKRQYRVGLNLFNKKPERGISYLIQKGFFENSPNAVAKFLISRKGVSKQMIGEYLGNLQNPFNMAALQCFAEEIDLSNLPIDVALRKFQTYFRMPGEAQKIERLMEVFGQKYCYCNPDVVGKLRNPDTVFILAFAIIMLNTDLHTPNLKPERRMKLEDFIKNVRGVDDGADVDKELLKGIYERVRESEFKPGSDHVTQVMKVQQSIVGKKLNLVSPHRRLVCYCRLYEVPDVMKKERPGIHQREVFLFNDLLVVTKILSKKKNSITYNFRQNYPLYGLHVGLFDTAHYQFGIKVSQKSDGKVLLMFNARNDHDRSKFSADLKEAILEMDEMENLRLEGELDKQRNSIRLSRVPGDLSQISPRERDNRDSGVADVEVLNLEKGTESLNRDGYLRPDTVMKKTTLSNSLLDIHEQMDKPQRRGSVGSLDSGMSISFQSSSATNSIVSRDSSPQNLQHQQLHRISGKSIVCHSPQTKRERKVSHGIQTSDV